MARIRKKTLCSTISLRRTLRSPNRRLTRFRGREWVRREAGTLRDWLMAASPILAPLGRIRGRSKVKIMAGSRAYFLRTERLGFDCWSAADLGLARELWGDPKVTELIGGPFNDEQIVERLGREIACITAHRVQYWPIFLLEDGRHAGCAG